MVLDVGTGTGYPALEVLRRMDDHGRIISIDASSAMLDVAREKAGALGGKRIFFRSETVEPKLGFAEEVFDLVMSNLALPDLDAPGQAVAEFARVAKSGGRVIATFPLAGTFEEFHDLFREVLIQGDRMEALERLDAYLATIPTAQSARRWFEAAGLVDVEVEHESYKLLFKSSREFFFAPVIEYGPLLTWKEIAGKGEEMQDVFWRVKEAIDAYFMGKSFTVTVKAACVVGRKPTEEERQAAGEAAEADRNARDLEDDEVPALSLTTDQVERIESTNTAGARNDRGGDEDDDDGDNEGGDLLPTRAATSAAHKKGVRR